MAHFETDDCRLVSAHVDAKVREKLLAVARREDRSLASLIRRALVRELELAHDEEEETT
jgi:hypothetical protein